MPRYQATVASRRPAPDTFGYLATFSNAAEWDPGVISAGATAGPPRLGSGRFWHDRRPRAEYRLPWTHEAPAAARLLWDRIESAERLAVTTALR
jgi:hypothetical protein